MSCGRRPALRTVVKWDVGRPAPRPPRTFAVMRSPADCVVGGGVPDAPGGVKTPPYDAKDKGDTMARLRAGHARPLRTTVNRSRTKGARGWLPLPFSPTKTKKRDGHCPVSFFLKKKEKNRTSRRRLNANGTTPLQVIPSLRIRQGALVFFLFSCRSEALAFDVLIVHYFCRICKMRDCTMCCNSPMHFCAVCTVVHSYFIQKAPVAFKSTGARNMRFVLL